MARSHHHVKHGGLSTSINSVIGKKPANPEQPSKASGMHHLFIRRVVASSEIQERITEMWGGIIPIAPRGLDSLDVTPFNELHSIALPTNTTAMVMKKLVRRYGTEKALESAAFDLLPPTVRQPIVVTAGRLALNRHGKGLGPEEVRKGVLLAIQAPELERTQSELIWSLQQANLDPQGTLNNPYISLGHITITAGSSEAINTRLANIPTEGLEVELGPVEVYAKPHR